MCKLGLCSSVLITVGRNKGLIMKVQRYVLIFLWIVALLSVSALLVDAFIVLPPGLSNFGSAGYYVLPLAIVLQVSYLLERRRQR